MSQDIHEEHEAVMPAVHYKAAAEDYKRRFILSAISTIPVLLLSPGVQKALGSMIDFPGRMIVLWRCLLSYTSMVVSSS